MYTFKLITAQENLNKYIAPLIQIHKFIPKSVNELD
jgi:hypothetical protein